MVSMFCKVLDVWSSPSVLCGPLDHQVPVSSDRTNYNTVLQRRKEQL